MAWSVESLPSNPVARVRFPAGSEIIIYILGLGAEGDCDFRISDLVKNPDGTGI